METLKNLGRDTRIVNKNGMAVDCAVAVPLSPFRPLSPRPSRQVVVLHHTWMRIAWLGAEGQFPFSGQVKMEIGNAYVFDAYSAFQGA